MTRFLIVIEKANGNYSAYSTDVPGCIATGATREEARKNMIEAMEAHVRLLQEENLPIPEASSSSEHVAIGA